MRMRRQAVCVGDTRNVPRQHRPQEGALATLTYDGGATHGSLRKPPQSSRPSLIVHGGPQDGASILISKSTVTMGCLPDNDIVINGPGVSRRHAEIVRMDPGFHIWDLGISNGTFVNQQHIGELTYPLQHGDQIRLADSNIHYVFSYAEASSQLVALPHSVEGTLGLIAQLPKLQEPSGILESISAGGQPSDVWEGVSEEFVPPSEERLYEGNVELKVESDGQIQLLIDFVTTLRMTPQVRVVRLAGNSPTHMEIRLALREPIHLEKMLAQMEGVSQLTELSQLSQGGSGPDGPEPVLGVKLGKGFSEGQPPIVDGSG